MLSQGLSLPFIARYRQEALGSTTETQLREIDRRYGPAMELESVKVKALESLSTSADTEMSSVMVRQIENATSVNEVTEICRPYTESVTSKRLSRLKSAMDNAEAVAAARQVRACLSNSCHHVDRRAAYIENTVILIAASIFADRDCRVLVRNVLRRTCRAVDRIRSHQWLSSRRRGETPEKIFPVDSSAITETIILLYNALIPRTAPVRSIGPNLVMNSDSCLQLFVEGIKSAVVSHFVPAIRREWVTEITTKAEFECIDSFSVNLHNKILQPGIRPTGIVMGIDPGLASGSKTVCFDPASGRVVESFKFNATMNKINVDTFTKHFSKYRPVLVVVGDGTGSAEAREFLARVVPDVDMCIVSESGASRYSVSELSMHELPDLPIEYRGCVSIVRRAIDPLSEYIKVDPQHLSVGMYQHDIAPKKLDKYLHQVVTECVSHVSVDLNTASERMLTFVPGLNRGTAAAIVQHRESLGRGFRNRKELLDVRGIGDLTWTHCIGFLQVKPSDMTPLDGTPVHPDDYRIANEVVRRHSEFSHLYSPSIPVPDIEVTPSMEATILQLLTLSDPRETIEPVIVRKAKEFALTTVSSGIPVEGTIVYGTVRNVVAFGAFINVSDAGLKGDGLLHIANYPVGVSDPHYFKINQQVKVRIEKVNDTGNPQPGRAPNLRIQLSARL